MPLLLLLLLLLSGCAAPGSLAPPPVLSGPPLALAGRYGDLALEGTMDRACMVGVGSLEFRSIPAGNFTCTAALDSPPNEKGRVKGLLLCSGRTVLPFTMRNLGPDQGFAVSRSSSDLLVFFYHPSADEALRRLPEIFSDIERLSRLQNGEDARAPEEGSPAGPDAAAP